MARRSPLMSIPMSRRRALQAGAAAGIAAGMLGRLPDVSRTAFAQDSGYDGGEATLTYGLWNQAQVPGLEQQMALFNETFPNITIEPQVVPFDNYWTQLQTGIAGGASTDVFWINVANFPVFASQGALLPITSIVGEGGAEADRYPEPLVNSYAWDGEQYGIPRDFDTIALYYNTTLFDAAGVEYPTADWTWDDMRTAAEALTTEGRWGMGAALTGQQNYYNLVWQNGGRLINDDLTECLLDEPEAAEALDYITGFFLDELIPPVSVIQGNDPFQTLFPAGQLAMIQGGSWHAGVFRDADPAIRVAPLPQGQQRACMIHGLANVIWEGTEFPEAALEWVKFLASEEAESILGESATVIPAMTGLQDAWVNSVPEMDLTIFLDAVDYSQSLPAPISGSEWQNEISRILIDGWSGNIPREEIAAEAAAAADAVLAAE